MDRAILAFELDLAAQDDLGYVFWSAVVEIHWKASGSQVRCHCFAAMTSAHHCIA
jgi:hypothetical protein